MWEFWEVIHFSSLQRQRRHCRGVERVHRCVCVCVRERERKPSMCACVWERGEESRAGECEWLPLPWLLYEDQPTLFLSLILFVDFFYFLFFYCLFLVCLFLSSFIFYSCGTVRAFFFFFFLCVCVCVCLWGWAVKGLHSLHSPSFSLLGERKPGRPTLYRT